VRETVGKNAGHTGNVLKTMAHSVRCESSPFRGFEEPFSRQKRVILLPEVTVVAGPGIARSGR
jgi:hypothetical protein